MSRQRREYDCQRCGACCCNPDQNRAEGYVDYVQVKRGDAILERGPLARRLVVVNDAGEMHMRMIHDRCAALEGKIGKKVTCSIYEVRPTPCRRVEAGSESCLARRRERGVGD
jgi:Fe-S-cluster containining protein